MLHKRKVAVGFLLVLTLGLLCTADQLQWNDRDTCEQAAQWIRETPVLMEFCSLCNAAPVDLWLVHGVDIRSTPSEGRFEVVITGWKVERSSGRAEWSSQAVDLAYVYVPVGNDRFRCLGEVLGLPCWIKVSVLKPALPWVGSIHQEQICP